MKAFDAKIASPSICVNSHFVPDASAFCPKAAKAANIINKDVIAKRNADLCTLLMILYLLFP